VATWGSLLRQAAEAGLKLLTQPKERDTRTTPSRSPQSTTRPGEHPRPSTGGARSAPSSDRARRVAYAPDLDGAADPGEIVWTWVPFEEDASQGKDRPLLVVGRRQGELLGLMLSSQHRRDGEQGWIGIGSGEWDREGRESFIRLDRVLEVGEHDIRREGAILDEARFDRVADALRSRYGWG
jgi:hypothetical protein